MELVVESNRSTVVLAIVLLVVGAVVGFGIGFGVGNGTKSDVKVAAATSGTGANQKTNQTPAQTQAFNQFVRCMANHGVTWPGVVGRSQIATPPAGVDHAKYNKALVACYQSAKTGATTVPSTSSN
jgi:hypothetical protein